MPDALSSTTFPISGLGDQNIVARLNKPQNVYTGLPLTWKVRESRGKSGN